MVSKKLHILIVTAWYPNEGNPTEGSFVQEQVSMLKNLGHSIVVLHPFLLGTYLGSRKKKDQIFEEYIDECRVIRVGVKPVVPGFRGLAYFKLFRKTEFALHEFNIDSSDFDIIHSHSMFMGGFIANKFSKKFQKPHVHTEHTSGLISNPNQYSYNDRKIIRKVISQSHKNLFVSRFSLHEVLCEFKLNQLTNSEVLGNVVAPQFFTEYFETNEPIHFRYISISNLNYRKRNHLLIKSFQKISTKFPLARLTIAGEGSETEKLIKLVEDLGLQESVTFLPKLNRKEVRDQILQHHVLVSASQIETFGLTVAEAQAMGKPVVATDSGGVRDIVTQETGIICEGNEIALTNALFEIQLKYEKYDHQRIRELTYNQFSESVIGLKLEKIYSQILNQS